MLAIRQHFFDIDMKPDISFCYAKTGNLNARAIHSLESKHPDIYDYIMEYPIQRKANKWKQKFAAQTYWNMGIHLHFQNEDVWKLGIDKDIVIGRHNMRIQHTLLLCLDFILPFPYSNCII